MKIEGKVATVIFKNESNSWTVLLVKVGDEYITAVGDTTDIEVEDEIELEGSEGIHKVYGKQFKFDRYKKLLPKTNAALISYIETNVKGVGKKTAGLIVNMFGDETVNVICNNISKLEGIKGLNREKIIALHDTFTNEWGKWNTIDFLSQFNVSVIVSSKIYQVLGEDTINIVKQNPYSLLKFIKSIDYKLVDEIGRSVGVALDSPERVDAGILFSIRQATEFGHTCIEYNMLVKYASELLEVHLDDICNGITRLKLNDKVYIQTIEDEEYIFERAFFLAEDTIASSIANKTKKKVKTKDFKDIINKVSEKNAIVLSDEQYSAICTCLNSPISVITGGPGTGKTTIIKCIIDIIEDMNKEYVLCAPTGRAAKRITETTGKEAKTIHRLLEIVKVADNDIEAFFDTDVKPVDTDVIIIDEASMIDCLMMSNLFRALKPSTQVIMVGDVDQLPSVGPGNVLKDIIDSEALNVVCLKHIFRQSAQSDIIINAHKVNNGEHLEFKTKDTDMFYIKTETIKDTLDEISSLVSRRLPGFHDMDVMKDIQILTPMKKTELGTFHLNGVLQDILNPKSNKRVQKEHGSKIFREGDKVMQIINNYDKKFSIDGNHFEGVYNGDIGYIESINLTQQKLYILFDSDKLVEYEFEELEQIEHAYAVTIHKSQGSEFDYVILPLLAGYPKLFTRNLLYTAMTRAKKMLVIVGNINVVNFMIDNIESKKRKTGLKYKIIAKI